jgi:dUTP pyrophosphatase
MELEPGFEGQVRPRSGFAGKGLLVPNSPGTIDFDFRGEIRVLLRNLGLESITIQHGDRIAQLVIAAVPQVTILKVEVLSDTARGEGGFGSTGVS